MSIRLTNYIWDKYFLFLLVGMLLIVLFFNYAPHTVTSDLPVIVIGGLIIGLIIGLAIVSAPTYKDMERKFVEGLVVDFGLVFFFLIYLDTKRDHGISGGLTLALAFYLSYFASADLIHLIKRQMTVNRM